MGYNYSSRMQFQKRCHHRLPPHFDLTELISLYYYYLSLFLSYIWLYSRQFSILRAVITFLVLDRSYWLSLASAQYLCQSSRQCNLSECQLYVGAMQLVCACGWQPHSSAVHPPTAHNRADGWVRRQSDGQRCGRGCQPTPSPTLAHPRSPPATSAVRAFASCLGTCCRLPLPIRDSSSVPPTSNTVYIYIYIVYVVVVIIITMKKIFFQSYDVMPEQVQSIQKSIEKIIFKDEDKREKNIKNKEEKQEKQKSQKKINKYWLPTESSKTKQIVRKQEKNNRSNEKNKGLQNSPRKKKTKSQILIKPMKSKQKDDKNKQSKQLQLYRREIQLKMKYRILDAKLKLIKEEFYSNQFHKQKINQKQQKQINISTLKDSKQLSRAYDRISPLKLLTKINKNYKRLQQKSLSYRSQYIK